MTNIVIENAMLVDERLQQYLNKNGIKVDIVFNGLKWKSDEEINGMIGHILSGEKKNIYLATSYMEPEFVKEMFAAIHMNVASVSAFIYDLHAEEIVIGFSRKYPAVKFELLNRHMCDL